MLTSQTLIGSEFWQQWQQHQNHLYNCCINWMGGNPTEAEDALSQAMLKAWHEWQKDTTTIKYPKAWLTRLIYNVCMDIHRKFQREAPVIENIEELKFTEYAAFACGLELPESKILNGEMRVYLYQKIKSLPDQLRRVQVTFVRTNVLKPS